MIDPEVAKILGPWFSLIGVVAILIIRELRHGSRTDKKSDDLDESVNALRTKVESFETKLEERTRGFHQRISDQVERESERHVSVETEFRQMNETMDHVARDIGRMTSDISVIRERVEGLIDRVESHERKITALETNGR